MDYKKIAIAALGFAVAFVSLALPLGSQAAGDVNIYFFRGEGCPHCAKEEVFLEDLKERYPEVKVYDYEIYYDAANRKLLKEASEILGVRVDGVPFTVIGEKHWIGFAEGPIPQEMEEAVLALRGSNYSDPLKGLLLTEESEEATESATTTAGISKEIGVPLFGSIDIGSMSLPLLTVVMGALDGFNPCAMWTLLFLISLLLNMKDRRRMWTLGTLFIVASALVYFVFMATWLNLIIFLGFIVWIRIIIGLIAIAGGGWNIKEYFTTAPGVCKVTGDEKRQRVFDRLKAIVEKPGFWIAAGGIVLLAFAVNLVELVCSAGLPAIYTQVLAMNDLAGWQYYGYILGYIFFFMLDDLIVFVAAMWTLKMVGPTTKYAHLSKIIGGTIMVLLGLALIFKPEWLMFG